MIERDENDSFVYSAESSQHYQLQNHLLQQLQNIQSQQYYIAQHNQDEKSQQYESQMYMFREFEEKQLKMISEQQQREIESQHKELSNGQFQPSLYQSSNVWQEQEIDPDNNHQLLNELRNRKQLIKQEIQEIKVEIQVQEPLPCINRVNGRTGPVITRRPLIFGKIRDMYGQKMEIVHIVRITQIKDTYLVKARLNRQYRAYTRVYIKDVPYRFINRFALDQQLRKKQKQKKQRKIEQLKGSKILEQLDDEGILWYQVELMNGETEMFSREQLRRYNLQLLQDYDTNHALLQQQQKMEIEEIKIELFSEVKIEQPPQQEVVQENIEPQLNPE